MSIVLLRIGKIFGTIFVKTQQKQIIKGPHLHVHITIDFYDDF